MRNAAQRSTTQEVARVGLIGADRYVHQMMEVARKTSHPGLRLVPGSYRHESEAATSARKIADQVDVILFAGPLPYDLARSEGDLGLPATFVPTGGSALHSALVRALSGDLFDPQRISIDSMSKGDVSDAYDEVGLSSAQVQCKPYDAELSPDDYLEFHRSLHRRGRTVGAVTTIPSVQRTLEAEGIPCLQMVPSLGTLRQSLNNAVLLGSGAKFEESRIAVVIAQLPVSSLPPRTSPAQYWFQELRLALHRELLRDARRMDAIVLPHDQNSFMVFSTLGSLRLITDDLTEAPFAARISEVLNVDLEIGIGLGRSTLEAENNAYRAVAKASDAQARAAYLEGPDEMSFQLKVGDQPVTPRVEPAEEKELAVLRQMVEQLGAEGEDRLVVDAEKVAAMTRVTLRTARRTLQTLVQAGLAWPLPPARSKKVGRPPMLYQLLDERLDTSHSPPPAAKAAAR
ncbi:hypothetical protein ACQBAR_01790 [Propionibacteriaceae bacterium Y1685]|uniref:hypothetical protein n=1 Tax=Microlunatus sp. Y1700 TaxID=3418487 RepID=UPI003B7FD628